MIAARLRYPFRAEFAERFIHCLPARANKNSQILLGHRQRRVLTGALELGC